MAIHRHHHHPRVITEAARFRTNERILHAGVVLVAAAVVLANLLG